MGGLLLLHVSTHLFGNLVAGTPDRGKPVAADTCVQRGRLMQRGLGLLPGHARPASLGTRVCGAT